MTARLMLLLLLAQTALAVSTPGPAEPNDTIPGPHFEIRPWPRKGFSVDMDHRVSCVAEVNLPWGEMRLPAFTSCTLTSGRIRTSIAKSPLIQRLSPTQRALLPDSINVNYVTKANPRNQYTRIRLSALNVEDARVLARAVLDGLTIQMQEDYTEYKHRLEEAKQEYERARIELPAKKKRLAEVEAQYDQYKQQIYPNFIDGEALEQAKERMIQMDRDADTLDIELAGTRAKLKIIDDYRARPNLSNDIIEKLETMRIDQLIEQSGLAARRETVERIRTTQQQFHHLYEERKSLRGTVNKLDGIQSNGQLQIDTMTAELKYIEEKFIAPLEDPKRKVTIYSKIPEDSQN